jgi:KDO2-lipid IV(A) lauroyltransferase
VKGALGYATYRALSALFSLFPEPAMRRIGYGMGWLLSFVAGDRFRMAQRHQRRVQGPDVDLRRAARRVFGYYGRYWAETFWMTPRRRDGVLRRSILDNVEILHAAVASDRGVVLALPHTGNWEAAGLRAAAEGARVLAVAEALPNERIVDWFTRMRAMMDIDIVIARKGGRVTRDLMARLEVGGTIALLSDRDLKRSGVPVTLFGEGTTMPAGPVAMADRTGATLLPVGVYFLEGAGHRFVVHPPVEIPDLPDRDERIRIGTERLGAVLEEIIRVHPEQWHLVLPNWPSDREDAS